MIFFIDGIWKIQFYTKIIILENQVIKVKIKNATYEFFGKDLSIVYLQKDEINIKGLINKILITYE
ncbi:MAG: YabP/YqfC family sporulation protein [Bacilli bacterium]